jgi:hypothetical protein
LLNNSRSAELLSLASALRDKHADNAAEKADVQKQQLKLFILLKQCSLMSIEVQKKLNSDKRISTHLFDAITSTKSSDASASVSASASSAAAAAEDAAGTLGKSRNIPSSGHDENIRLLGLMRAQSLAASSSADDSRKTLLLPPERRRHQRS